MTKSSSTCIFNLAVNLMLLTMSSADAQKYSSSISQMKSLPPYLEDIANQLENLIIQIRTDLRVLNETRDRLNEIKIKPKNKSDTFVFMNKLMGLKNHITRRYNLVLDPDDFPRFDDVNGNLFSIAVLQSTYNLNINDICKGYLKQEHTNIDLYHKLMIIYFFYNVHESHIHPIGALHEAIHSINDNFSETHLYKDIQTKAKWVDIANLYKLIIHKLSVKHRDYVIKLIYYILNYLSKECEMFRTIFINVNMEFIRPNLNEILNHKGGLAELNNESTNAPPSRWNPYVDEPEINMPLEQYEYYSQLCQGLHQPIFERPLVCYYKSQDAYHLLNPFKVEQLYWDPPIVLLRDFVSETEIQTLIREATPDLEKSTIGSSGVSIDSILRISAKTWLIDLPPSLQALDLRIVSFVPLENESETLQVNNYGIGGLYTPHLDNMYQRENPDLEPDRLATFMIYMTDNPYSGATIFPRLNLTFFPSRGSAIFWYNLYSNGSPDFRTLHAGCPVLTGDKWVVNKWYSNYGQMFRHPCLKDENVLSRQDVNRIFSHYAFSDEEDKVSKDIYSLVFTRSFS